MNVLKNLELTKVENLNIESLKIYSQLRDNNFTEDNSFIADSPKVVNILLQTDLRVKSILATAEYYEEFAHLLSSKEISKLYVAEKSLMQTIVGHKIHHNCMMHGIRPKESLLDDLGDNIIMLDSITSSENIGSIARSAAALGVSSYLVPDSSPHPYGRRALRVSMGYVSQLNIHIYDDIFVTLNRLKKNGYKIFAAEVTDSSMLLSEVEIPKEWVLLMGHEGKGLSPEVLDVCDEVVQIEMQSDVKSFNVGVASSIMMYQFKNRVKR